MASPKPVPSGGPTPSTMANPNSGTSTNSTLPLRTLYNESIDGLPVLFVAMLESSPEHRWGR